jgi:ubiquinone/menaquinone biosynthesis C-methylase UbiE
VTERKGIEMRARDAMQFMNEQDEATIARFVERLEFRGRDETFTGYRNAYLDAMELPTEAIVVEIGCGTGVVTRALAAREHFAAKVVGLEQSPVLVEAARGLAADAGLQDRIEFRVGDVHALDLADASVDAVVAHTLLSHVTDPGSVLSEAARVLRPGGVLAAFDGDYSSWTWACSDPELARAMEDALRVVIASQPRVMREMPGLLRHTGLSLVDATAHVYAEIGQGSYFLSFVDAYAPLVEQAEILPREEVERWVAEQREAQDLGTFFAACNYYAYLARKQQVSPPR